MTQSSRRVNALACWRTDAGSCRSSCRGGAVVREGSGCGYDAQLSVPESWSRCVSESGGFRNGCVVLYDANRNPVSDAAESKRVVKA